MNELLRDLLCRHERVSADGEAVCVECGRVPLRFRIADLFDRSGRWWV